MDPTSKLQSCLASFDAGEKAWGATRLQRELNELLVRSGLRVIDVVRSWDVGSNDGAERGGDALISRKEYMAMPHTVPPYTLLCVSPQ